MADKNTKTKDSDHGWAGKPRYTPTDATRKEEQTISNAVNTGMGEIKQRTREAFSGYPSQIGWIVVAIGGVLILFLIVWPLLSFPVFS